jgi:protein ImuB
MADDRRPTTDNHRADRQAWERRQASLGAPTGKPGSAERRRVTGDEARVTPALRQLDPPEAVEVECEGGAPRVLWWRGRRLRLEHVVGPERLSGEWWEESYTRDYWRCEETEDASELVLFHDGSAAGRWYVQGWYD